MTNALLNRFRRSMRVRDVFMLASTLLRFYSRTLRRTTTCTSIQCTGSLHRWTSILQTGVFVQTLQYSLVYQKGEIPNILVNEVKFPSNICLAARVLTERLIKISLKPDSWNLLKAAQLDENVFLGNSRQFGALQYVHTLVTNGQFVGKTSEAETILTVTYSYRRFSNIFSWCEDVVEGHFQKKTDLVPISSTTSVVRQRL